MIVNGTDLRKKYGANVMWLSQTVKNRNVTVFTNWLDTGFAPVKCKPNKYTDFEIIIDMLINGTTKEECELIMSSILSDFDTGLVQLDNMEFTYKFDFAAEEKELVKRWKYSYKITLSGYCKLGKKERIEFSGTDFTFDVKGTADTPAVITLSSDIALNTLSVSGITPDAITINAVQRNSKIILNGEDPAITEDGNNILKKCDLWDFPVLHPGENIIKLSSICTAEIEYYPRYK